ncbi:phosphatidate cytidylyltransferase [Thermophagus sp. OGC60D27]|uniref:phosphatidate cytidylyltransferase n=1 Tax=Thermophagus sp. OGC60D27 TaxID=3458415 RepID=UPI004037E031
MMVKLIYGFILAYFVLGGIGFYFINRKREAAIARKSYTKFFVYFIIINILFFSITLQSVVFKYLVYLIIGGGFAEMYGLYHKSGHRHNGFFILSLVVYSLLSVGLNVFSEKDKGLLLFVFLVVSIFDSFSQITGQLWGRRKLVPSISPNKTYGGLIGGMAVTVLSAALLQGLYPFSGTEFITVTLGTIFFAFAGDLGASYYKRVYQVKDFSRLIPGHGGILDRFDSLITGGAWVGVCALVFGF